MDITTALEIIDAADVWGLAMIVVIGFVRAERKHDRAVSAIEKLLAVHNKELEKINEWRVTHTDNDRVDHARIHERIDSELRRA